MLYIFLVNTGQTMTFEMDLAIESVENLKLAIFQQYQIPVYNQVLLISGGESLNNKERVCKYNSAGTDTSPIFLFSKNEIELPMSSADTDNENMEDRVQSCLQMEPNFNTVVARTEMAHQLFETDKILYHSCDRLIHDQHLQQQGWMSVVANLEDIVHSLKTKVKKFEQLFTDVLKNKFTYYEWLNSFEQDKQLLSRIPILRALQPNKSDGNDDITLLDWIIQKDNKSSLDSLYCMDELNAFTQEELDQFKWDVDNVLKESENPEYREIKGLESRFYHLEKMMVDAKKGYERQNILTKGFNQNQTRISDLRDTSILPDLCQNHKEQLSAMLNNHRELIQIKQRCLNSKVDLSNNICKRIQWISHIEEGIKRIDKDIFDKGVRLKQIQDRLEIIHNLHLAPQVYLSSIVEVLRRKTFADNFYNWAKNVSQIATQMIDSEKEHRQAFSAQLDKHFVKLFFPGMNDYPQNFISDFIQTDQSLPPISFDDVAYLKDKLPDMTSQLLLPSQMPLPLEEPIGQRAPLVKSPSEQQVGESQGACIQIDYEDSGVETLLTAKDISLLESAKLDMESCLCEKNQLIEDLVNQLNNAEMKCREKEDLVASCSDLNAKVLNLMKSFKLNVFNDINDQISNCSQNFQDCLKQVNHNLEQLNAQMHEERSNFEQQIEEKVKVVSELNETIATLQKQLDAQIEEFDKLSEAGTNDKSIILSQLCEIEKLKESIENLRTEHGKKHTTIESLNEKIKNLKSKLEQSKREITVIFNNFVHVEMQHFAEQYQAKVEELKKENERSVKAIEERLVAEKETQVQKLREEMSLEHKNELDSLRHRFKLAISTTSIERTSSETSLEKVQLDIVDQSVQEKELQKMKSLISEQKLEHDQSVAKIRSEYENTIHGLMTELNKERLNLNENLCKYIKDSELSPDQLIHRMKQYETLFSRLNTKLNVDIENLDMDKCKEVLTTLLKDLSETNRSLENFNFTRSFISIPTSPESPQQSSDIDSIATKYKLKNLELVTPNNDDKISVTSCEFGDNVLVYYEKKLENYIVFSLTNNLHYIHSDSLKECDFSKEMPPNEFQWIFAKVMEKEYCQIKKEENRYKLPVNTKFYRVKIKQISKCNTSPLKTEQANLMNRSYMPSTSNRTLLSNIMSFFGTSFETAPNMSQSYNFEKN